MFIKEGYVLTLLCLVVCVINQCIGQNAKGSSHSIITRKIKEKRSVDYMKDTYILKTDKMSARHIKRKKTKNENTSKWPKLLRQGKVKDSLRITKMDMMQETVDATEFTASLDKEESSEQYFSSYSIKQDLAKLKNELPHTNVTLEVIGRTLEYQDIVMLRITELKDESKFFRADDHKYAEEVPEKKIIFITHGLSVMGLNNLECLSFIYSFRILLSYYLSHLNKFDIFLIPLANPDGYSYIRTQKYPIWNKNVAPQTECPGVALDRNFQVAWENNRSISSCSQDYPGPAPFSEAETRAIRDIFHKYAHKIIAYLNVHAVSYYPSIFRGDAVLYPKGYTDATSDDDKYIDLKGEIDEAIRNASFQVLSVAVDTLYNWYGRVTGTSVDYASTIYGIPYAMELAMQTYENPFDYNSETESYTDLALNEVWRRIIDVIFLFIWKSLHGNDV